MNPRQEGSSDLMGMLSVLASALAVVLVVVAAVTDRAALLGVAAVVAGVSVALVLVRRSVPRRRPGPATTPIVTDPRSIGPTEPHEAADADKRYRDEAVTARADLLATLRHGFRTDADDDPALGSDPDPDASPTKFEDDRKAGPASSDATPSAAGPPRAPSPAGAAPPGGSLDDPRSATPNGPHPSDPVGGNTDPLFDPVTGLFTQDFFEASLPKRVSAARRGLRPLSLAVVDVVVGRPVAHATAVNRAVVAAAMTEVFRDADTIAIAHDGLFLVLLEDTPEAGAVWTLERLRRHLDANDPDHTMWAGVSCYPAYSFDAEGLIAQARDALESARQWQQDRIEIAAHASD